MLPQGLTVVFATSEFSADIRTLSIETLRGDHDISNFNDMYRALSAGDLIDGGTLSMGVGFDPDLSPPY